MQSNINTFTEAATEAPSIARIRGADTMEELSRESASLAALGIKQVVFPDSATLVHWRRRIAALA
jgi:hypothetical protein